MGGAWTVGPCPLELLVYHVYTSIVPHSTPNINDVMYDVMCWHVMS